MKNVVLLTMLLCIMSNVQGEVRFDKKVHHPRPVFVHAVYFWLHDHVTEAQKEEFIELLKSFRKIKSVKSVHLGIPANTPRTVVDNTYDVALIVTFRDKAGHDYYQTDNIHTDAIKKFEAWVKDIRIYDMVTERVSDMQY